MAYDISNLCCKQKKYNLATDVINGSLSPLISIIVPLYNTSVDCFVRMITSVIAQTYENWELVLVDDCSLDKSYIKYLNTITKNYNSIALLSGRF